MHSTIPLLSSTRFAYIPIVKFTDRQTLVKVEIAFNERVACDIQKLYQIFMAWYPQLPVLLLIIKQLLTVQELNKTYPGGMSSFILIHLLVSFFQNHLHPYPTEYHYEGTSVTRHRRCDLSTKKGERA